MKKGITVRSGAKGGKEQQWHSESRSSQTQRYYVAQKRRSSGSRRMFVCECVCVCVHMLVSSFPEGERRCMHKQTIGWHCLCLVNKQDAQLSRWIQPPQSRSTPPPSRRRSKRERRERRGEEPGHLRWVPPKSPAHPPPAVTISTSRSCCPKRSPVWIFMAATTSCDKKNDSANWHN